MSCQAETSDAALAQVGELLAKLLGTPLGPFEGIHFREELVEGPTLSTAELKKSRLGG